jgi:hypothetical protein
MHDFLGDINLGGGQRGSRLKAGRTILYLVQDPSAIGGHCFAETHSIYKGQKSDRFVSYAFIVHADNATGLSEGWQGAVVPVVFAKTVAAAVATALMGDEFTKPAKLSKLNAKTGKFTAGSAFKVNFDPDKKEYTVAVLDADMSPATPDKLELPPEPIADFAAAYAEWQDSMAAKQAAEAADAPPVNNGLEF